ncbi:MAG: hypothetical protein ABEI52_12815 [Halobacteriaceae archaeon]
MADEFAKGLGLLTGPGLIWMVIAGWYYTPSFEGAQLNGSPPEDPSTLDSLAMLLGDAMLILAVGGALTFWVLIPALREFNEWRASGG